MNGGSRLPLGTVVFASEEFGGGWFAAFPEAGWRSRVTFGGWIFAVVAGEVQVFVDGDGV